MAHASRPAARAEMPLDVHQQRPKHAPDTHRVETLLAGCSLSLAGRYVSDNLKPKQLLGERGR
jgi:hypothetical protein